MSLCSYHTHTRWSDGKSDIDAMAAAAAEAGLAEIGLSDHYVLTPHARTNAGDWSMPLDRLGEYVAEVQAAAGNAAVTVRLGIEADYFPRTWRKLEKILRSHPFDYVIGSVHYVGSFPLDYSPDAWTPLTQHDIDDIYRGYWQAIRELAEAGIYDFVGHLDLPKKFGFRPACDLSGLIEAALDAIGAADLAVELNTAGWDKPCADGYPSEELVHALHERGIPMLLSADAHAPDELVRHYDKGFQRLAGAGYTELVTFAGRRRAVQPLESIRDACAGVGRQETSR